MKQILLVAGIVSLAWAPLRAQDTSGKLQKIVTEIQAELDQKKPAKEVQPGFRQDTAHMMLAQLRGAMTSGDPFQVEALLQQVPVYIDSEAIRKECDDLAAQLHGERQARGKKMIEDIDAALTKAGEAVRSAKKSADLDATLHELSVLAGQRNEQQPWPAASNALNKVQPALQFVRQWQDYLAAVESGNPEAARQSLQNLSNGNMGGMGGVDLIPRSEILERMRNPVPAGVQNQKELAVEKPIKYFKETDSIEFDIKTLDELNGVIDALDRLKNKPGFENFRNSLNSLTETLMPLERAYKEFQAGLSVNIVVPSHNPQSTGVEEEILHLKEELVGLALPRYLGLPAQTKLKPGESPYEFLDRIATDAAKRNDFLLVAKVRKTQELLRTGRESIIPESSQADLYVEASNQETAGQYALAVTSYEKALSVGTDLVPPEIIGKHLAAIKADHPQEFQQGFDLYLNPPMASRYPMGYPQGFYQGRPIMMQQQFTPYGGQQPAVLAIPAATGAPIPSPKPSKK